MKDIIVGYFFVVTLFQNVSLDPGGEKKVTIKNLSQNVANNFFF